MLILSCQLGKAEYREMKDANWIQNRKMPLKRVFAPAAFTLILLALGTLSFGPWTSFIFSFGFVGGFVLWLIFPHCRNFQMIKAPYWITFGIFIFFHRVEENLFRFQDRLSEITGTPVPSLTSPYLILLVLLTVGGWLMVAPLIKRKKSFGVYLAWSFFASMGITELAHFALPFFSPGPYGYFPGMASVFLLAPSAWWGAWRLMRRGGSTL